jgi:hypothetical protein
MVFDRAGVKEMFEFLIVGRDKCFRANDAGIREISGPVAEAVDAVDVKVGFPFFFTLSYAL